MLSPERGDILSTCLAVAASALGYFLVNTSLTAGVIALSERHGFLSVWRTNYAWMPVNFLATAAQGAALALASQALGIFGVLVFTLPLGVAWYSFRLYMSKSSEVRQRNAELQSVNEMLRRTNDRLEESHLSVIGALIGALEAKENSRAVAAARTMANQLWHQWIEALSLAGRGDYERALSLLERTRATCDRVGDLIIRMRIPNSVGWIYSELGDHQRALEWNQRGLTAIRASGHPLAEVETQTLLNVGENLLALGRFDEAEKAFLEVEQVGHGLNIVALRNTQLLLPALQRRCRKIVPAELRAEVIPD